MRLILIILTLTQMPTVIGEEGILAKLSGARAKLSNQLLTNLLYFQLFARNLNVSIPFDTISNKKQERRNK